MKAKDTKTTVNKYVVVVIRTKVGSRYRWVYDPYQTFPNLDNGRGDEVRKAAWQRVEVLKTLARDRGKLEDMFGITNIDAVYPVLVTDLAPIS